ncbi:hypothetical protein MMC29_008171 [Sticta canariensis]|nr:hypothetical protein [Sticta canariensis]
MASSTLQLKVPDNEKTSAAEVEAFLKVLDALAGSPRICLKIVTFSDKAHKKNWEMFQWSKTHATYSFTSKLVLHGARNRLFYFSHPAGTWVSSDHDWKTEAWHSWAVALINTGHTGLTMVIYDVDCVTENELAAEGKPWNVISLTLHRSYLGADGIRSWIRRMWQDDQAPYGDYGLSQVLGL